MTDSPPEPTPTPNPWKRRRFAAEMIGHGVQLHVRFCLSDRDGEDLMAERGVILTGDVMRQGCRTCGQADAHQVRRRRLPVKTRRRGDLEDALSRPLP